MGAVRKDTGKPFKKDYKRAAIELWKAQVPLSRIRAQLKMSESTLRRILAFAKTNPLDPISSRKPGSGKKRKISMETRRLMKKGLAENHSLSQLRGCINALGIQTIQDCCLKDLHLPSRRKAKKPILTQRMMEQRLEFAKAHVNWSMDDWKDVMFLDESHFELRFGGQEALCRRPRGSDSKVHKKDGQPPTQSHGVGLFQLEGERRARVLENWRDDEWLKISPAAG
jgi:hypothetical protein